LARGPRLTGARDDGTAHVADVLAEHVAFEVECIDRMYLNVYVPQLQYAAGCWGTCTGSLREDFSWSARWGFGSSSRPMRSTRPERRPILHEFPW
jgi:hypothetical protein